MRFTKMPHIYDDMLKFHISTIRTFLSNNEKCGYYLANTVIAWSRDGVVCSRVNVSHFPDNNELELSYCWNSKSMKYRVKLKRIESNLITGTHFYMFECPATHKLCRVLYLCNGVFVSRYAVPYAFYQSQMETKYTGNFGLLQYNIELEEVYCSIMYPERYCKRFYKDYVTRKWNIRLNKLIRKMNAGKKRYGGYMSTICERYPGIIQLFKAAKM